MLVFLLFLVLLVYSFGTPSTSAVVLLTAVVSGIGQHNEQVKLF